MNLTHKIEEIRSKPDHIRERYAWLAVGVCMLFVFLIWFFSLKNSLKIEKAQEVPENIKIETVE